MTRALSYSIEHILGKLGQSAPLRPFPRGSVPFVAKPNVGLTGASGWLGRHIARHLLSSNPDLYLIVPMRAENAIRGLGRLQHIWCPSPEWARRASEEHWWERTQVIPTQDLGKDWESSGLTNSPQSLDMVINSAANMSLALSLDGAWASNVLTTQNVYRWARECGAKSFHHVSTLSVFIAGETPPGRIFEEDPLEKGRVIHGGYAASKWAAEAWLAHQRDLPVAIHRPGLLSYSEEEGWAKGDGLFAVARAWKKWGCPEFMHPSVSDQVDWSPVNKVALGISEAALKGKYGAFHWASRLPVPATVLHRLWKERFGSAPGEWPLHEPLAKEARRALGRWSGPNRAAKFWWHDLFQSGPFEYDAQHASEILPQWSWTRAELEASLDNL